VTYRIAGIDVHKRMLAVVIADVAVEGEYQFERRRVGTSPSELCRLADWLVAQQVDEVVMESTAQYWRPVWATLEQRWRPKRLQESAGARSGQLHLAQAQSNRGAAGRKKDFPDAERLVKRLVAQELKLSFVPDVEQRLWRTIMRRKHQLTRNRVQFQNRLECLLEEAHIKLSSLVSDLLGKSARYMLQAVAEGDQSRDNSGTSGPSVTCHKHLASWVGVCPGEEESAGVNYSHRSPKGNRQMKGLLNQASNAAVKTKGSIFEFIYRRLVVRLGHAQAIGAIAHRLCRLIWMILHQAIRYEERGPAVSRSTTERRAAKMIRELRRLGYRIEPVECKAESSV